MHKFVIVTIQVGDFQLDFAGVVEIVDVAVVAVDNAGAVVGKTAVVAAVDSNFSDCPETASYCLGLPPGRSHALS